MHMKQVILGGLIGMGMLGMGHADPPLAPFNPGNNLDIVIIVDLDVDANYDQFISVDEPDDPIEVSTGGLVCVGMRDPIILRKVMPPSWPGEVLLMTNSLKVAVFDAPTGGTPMTFNGFDNKFLNSDLPRTQYVEGVTASDRLRDVNLTLTPIPRGREDLIIYTVLKVDLDVDSDFDRDIDEADDLIEMTTGGWVRVNQDDDNGNGTADQDDTIGTVAGENDLEPINLKLDPTGLRAGKLMLEAIDGGTKIRVWESATKETPVLLPKTWTLGVDVVPPTLYVEGVEASDSARDVELRLSYTNGSKVCKDNIKLTILKVELIPDYDRSGEIDDDDRTKANAGDKFYFWVNDDDDSGIEDDSKAGKQDIPGAVSGWLEFDGRDPDYEDDEIDGERDWVDFFPVFVDLKPTLDLIGTTGYKYVLKHTAGAVNAYVPTDLGPSDAAKHLRDHTYASAHDDATVQEITATGYELPTAFLNAVKDDGKGVILLEGRTTSTDGKLVIEVQKSDGTPICSRELPLSLDGVEKMFLHKNLRAAGGGSGGEADRTTAPNYPDELCNGKQFVFIHGYNVNAGGARGWEAETFKRMYWSRNNARFHAITWYGEESQTWYPILGYKCPNYHNNVVNAWETAPGVKNYLAGLSGGVYLAAHSLGNMVASCALSIDSGVVTKYFMLNGAVASEAFDSAQYNENMLHKNWVPFEALTDLYASEWHAIFGSGENRADLTWQDRFNAFASKVVNIYSTGDQVFDIHPKDNEPDIFEVLPHVGSGRYSWAFQEKRKGTSSFSGGDSYTFSHYAGWSFNDEDPPDGWTYQTGTDPETGDPIYSLYTPTMAAGITTAELVTKPFFGMGAGDFRNNLFTADTATANAWLTEANKWRVLAGAIPAMSLAAGRAPISAFGPQNVDMNVGLKPSYWPSRSGYGTDWLHSDIRNMAYIYTYLVFDEMVSRGGLE